MAFGADCVFRFTEAVPLVEKRKQSRFRKMPTVRWQEIRH